MKSILFNSITAKYLLKISLYLHTKSYILSGRLASVINGGVHPKHRIMKYKEWFLENIKEDWVILDVGCNTGMMAKVFSTKASFIYGIEIEENHIKKAREQSSGKNIKFICADATDYDYTALKSIDCITLSNVLEHIEFRVEFLKKLSSQIKWKDKKRFLIRVPMIDREWIAVYKKELGFEYRLDRTHFTEYIFIEFEDELKQAGIIIQNYHINFGEIYAVCEAIE